MEIIIGLNYYHLLFGWCKVTHPVSDSGKVLVELDADEIEYNVMGKGYVTSKRQNKGHSLYAPIDDLFEDKPQMDILMSIRKSAANVSVKVLLQWIYEHVCAHIYGCGGTLAILCEQAKEAYSPQMSQEEMKQLFDDIVHI
jgi:hypothetical protein